jgi:membrane fusion protein, type I secretion system
MNSDVQDPHRVIRKLNLLGCALVVLLIGGFGGWATTSELSGAVIAPGTVVVESYVKKVQHPTGGIVAEIPVKEGSVVEEGRIVMRLDDTKTRAALGVILSQLDGLLAKEARLVAERDGSENITFPDELLMRQVEKTVATALTDETKLFASRRGTRISQQARLRERIAQSNEEIRGLSAQKEAKEREIQFIDEELVGVKSLYGKNLVSISRLMTLQRDKTRLEGQHGDFVADIARARGKIAETELQIIQLDQDFLTELLKDLREAQAKIAELRERRTGAEDDLKRVVIRAPQSGIVHDLAVHTVGGVIDKGVTIMLIVPRADSLVVEAQVAPQDIDQIAVGATAAMRIRAGNQRMLPDVRGKVIHVSADLNQQQGSQLGQVQQGSQTAQAVYQVRISLPEEEVKRLGDLRLVPGMPVEAFIQTLARTPLEYLLKPLREQIGRTFRER